MDEEEVAAVAAFLHCSMASGDLSAAAGEIGVELCAALRCAKGKHARFPPLITARSGAQLVNVRDKALVCAGGNSTATGRSTRLASAEIFDAGRWSAAPSMRSARFLAAGCSADGHVCVLGGDDGGDYLATAEALAPGAESWEPLGSLPASVRGGAAVAVGSSVLLCGGHNGQTDTAACVTGDPMTGRWEQYADMGTARFACGLAELRGRVFAVGGFDDGEYLRSVESTDPREGRWQKGPPLRRARSAAACAAASATSSIVLIGGDAGESWATDAECFDMCAGRWRTFASLPGPLTGACATGWCGGVVVAGGSDRVLDGKEQGADAVTLWI
eukprot:TRINITY_DN31243_c0_g1_i1.p1 TRINITY_DN31243_c0_g1~~TRINITY_DN31243_c0_g1_i1.p1  ORF type:complete len:347 (+),score=87.49 TRINITY_DN31243_c0_g1_i1:50-1042(+)